MFLEQDNSINLVEKSCTTSTSDIAKVHENVAQFRYLECLLPAVPANANFRSLVTLRSRDSLLKITQQQWWGVKVMGADERRKCKIEKKCKIKNTMAP